MHILTVSQLLDLLRAAGISPLSMTVMDQQYACVASYWMTGDGYMNFKRFLTANQGSLYREEAWDCDDFALAFYLYARLCNKLSAVPVSVGVGVITYLRDSIGSGHAVNFYVEWKEDKPRVLFFEPQTGERVTLTESEISNAIAVIV